MERGSHAGGERGIEKGELNIPEKFIQLINSTYPWLRRKMKAMKVLKR